MTAAAVLPPIVVAEDSADDLFFLKRRLKQAGIQNPVLSFGNGRQAVEFLEQSGHASVDGKAAPHPCLILLDIKMPVMSGLEVLAWARKQTALATIPIVMLSGSTAESDMAKARELGAQYLIKPASPDRLAEIARQGNGLSPHG
jgi:CheY-like chemotaxis protein